MSLPLILNGAQAELVQMTGFAPRARRIVSLLSIMKDEVIGTLKLAPYGLRALCLHQESTFLKPPLKHPFTPCIEYDMRYGPKPRNLIDVYTPIGLHPRATTGPCASVVLFVHGGTTTVNRTFKHVDLLLKGTWSSGEKWQYAPLASSLAMQGVTTCVMSYTLFPEASAEEIANEVNIAVDWVLANLGNQNGIHQPKVTIVGHSAGAQIVMKALLERTKQSKRMPDLGIGMCGVYDIAEHYEFERSRGVHELSTMKRAMGGCHRFAEQSPTNMLRRTDLHYGVSQLPPILLMTSRADTTVPSSQSLAFCEALRGRGCQAECVIYDDVLHSHFATVAWTTELYRMDNDRDRFIFDFVSAVKGRFMSART